MSRKDGKMHSITLNGYYRMRRYIDEKLGIVITPYYLRVVFVYFLKGFDSVKISAPLLYAFFERGARTNAELNAVTGFKGDFYKRSLEKTLENLLSWIQWIKRYSGRYVVFAWFAERVVRDGAYFWREEYESCIPYGSEEKILSFLKSNYIEYLLFIELYFVEGHSLQDLYEYIPGFTNDDLGEDGVLKDQARVRLENRLCDDFYVMILDLLNFFRPREYRRLYVDPMKCKIRSYFLKCNG